MCDVRCKDSKCYSSEEVDYYLFSNLFLSEIPLSPEVSLVY